MSNQCCQSYEVYAMEARGKIGELTTTGPKLCVGHVSRSPGSFVLRVTDQADGQGGGLDPSVVAMLRCICHGQIPSESDRATGAVVIHRVTKLTDCTFIFTLQRRQDRMPEIFLCVPRNTDVTTRFAPYRVPVHYTGLWHDTVLFRQREPDRKTGKCAICMDRGCERRLPCGHGALCMVCVDQMPACPFCRVPFAPHLVIIDGDCQLYSNVEGMKLRENVHFDPEAGSSTPRSGTLRITREGSQTSHRVVERVVHTTHVSNYVGDLISLSSVAHQNVVPMRACLGDNMGDRMFDYMYWVNLPGPYTLRLYSDRTNSGTLANPAKAMTRADRCFALEGAWKGLRYLGTQGYFHCDIQSANIFLQREGNRIDGWIGDVNGRCVTFWEKLDASHYYGYPFNHETVYPSNRWGAFSGQRIFDVRMDGSQADQVMLGQGGEVDRHRRPGSVLVTAVNLCPEVKWDVAGHTISTWIKGVCEQIRRTTPREGIRPVIDFLVTHLWSLCDSHDFKKTVQLWRSNVVLDGMIERLGAAATKEHAAASDRAANRTSERLRTTDQEKELAKKENAKQSSKALRKITRKQQATAEYTGSSTLNEARVFDRIMTEEYDKLLWAYLSQLGKQPQPSSQTPQESWTKEAYAFSATDQYSTLDFR